MNANKKNKYNDWTIKRQDLNSIEYFLTKYKFTLKYLWLRTRGKQLFSVFSSKKFNVISKILSNQ